MHFSSKQDVAPFICLLVIAFLILFLRRHDAA